MLDQPAAQLPVTQRTNEASAAALLGTSINYPLRGTNAAAGAFSNLASPCR